MSVTLIIGAAIGAAVGGTIGYFGSRVKTEGPC